MCRIIVQQSWSALQTKVGSSSVGNQCNSGKTAFVQSIAGASFIGRYTYRKVYFTSLPHSVFGFRQGSEPQCSTAPVREQACTVELVNLNHIVAAAVTDDDCLGGMLACVLLEVAKFHDASPSATENTMAVAQSRPSMATTGTNGKRNARATTLA
jgi:hypothetical protein